ncbi:BgTH12-02691 [Blumeria graminis f. sp. triticale]|uniref:BgtA-20391 n=3 Tax=Blumeria graminis TaxID=34373 RepID=A0A9X9MI21_BLUGR|nr:hypothetical protein BGT96224_A20391 [Blumeria graminis f. sp. tritici 96224]CAD6503020.1 BgTH12-02691 [Blumeria graminis f. sp. triticale]VDB88958.1 BgtA-20391 [Blumeria graminis f. sp. tritici]
MDLGTMTKKLKTLTYKSKAEFVADLNLIWNNCLKYNADVQHPLRRNANSMRKEAEKLVPLIPDLVIRPRAEVEAEERRKQNGGDDDIIDDSDDEPIMSSRGRKAGTKGSKSRKTAKQEESTEQKPNLYLNGIHNNPDLEGFDMALEGCQNGLATPPFRSFTPLNGTQAHGNQSDIVKNNVQSIATLAEGMEGDEERVLPDYYDYLSAIPEIPAKLQWLEDSDGHLIDCSEEYMRMVPKCHFTSPKSSLTIKFDANMRQIQETRKICSKIGVIKQMQLQAQTYNNQFPRYEPEPFIEADIEPHVVSDDGPIMATWVCKAAMQRSVAKNGLEIETLESYVKDDVERLGIKLGVMHERMRAHLSDLLRPVLTDGGADGSGAFKDGSDQFIGGDFAEELGEDFFGFKALGLDSEFGMSSLSVPLHLLHTRLYNNQPSQVVQGPSTDILKSLPPLKPVTLESINDQIGLIRNFFLAKLHANSDQPLIEDEELPPKQRPSRPRLGPTGKITCPRKRPLKEVSGNSKKKKRLDNGNAVDPSTGSKTNINGSLEKGISAVSSSKISKLSQLNSDSIASEQPECSRDSQGQVEKDDISAVCMMSPESIER